MNLFSGSAVSIGSALSLRRRSVWEAADSGILLWRKNFAFFIPFFAVPVWIAACAVRLLPTDIFSARLLPYLALWWLKPLFDRLALQVVSVRFFDSSAGYRDIRRSLRKSAFRGLLGDLLWRRFNPGRGAQMPIKVLERAGRGQYRQRKKSLAAGGLNFCFLLGALGLFMEGFLLAGEILFSAIAVRLFQPSFAVYLRHYIMDVEIFVFAAYCLNFIIIESLYVCMGFGLYINSRVEIEGWDLQLLFQKFAGQDSGPKASGPALKTALLVLVFSAVLLGPASRPVYAEEDEPVSPTEMEYPPARNWKDLDMASLTWQTEFFPEGFPALPEESLAELEAVLSSRDFGGTRESWRIRYKYEHDMDAAPDAEFPSWMERAREFFSYLLRLLLVLAIAAFVGYAAYRLVRIYRNSQWRRTGARRKGGVFANPLLSPESPESLFAAAERFFERGDVREAWAACLSACLGAYSRNHLLSFPADATEYGCLGLVSRKLPEEAGGFGDLVNNWVLLAYGGRVPGQGAFAGALAYGRSLLEPRESVNGESINQIDAGESHEA